MQHRAPRQAMKMRNMPALPDTGCCHGSQDSSDGKGAQEESGPSSSSKQGQLWDRAKFLEAISSLGFVFYPLMEVAQSLCAACSPASLSSQ